MADPETDEQHAGRPHGRSDLAIQNTPNAERYVLEADAMRRRQLRSALLHGTGRNWRENRRAWPGVVAGMVVVAVVIAGLAVSEAFQKTQENEREREQQQEQRTEQVDPTPGGTAPASPSPTDEAPAGAGSPTSPAS
jgi:hypothetical protein